LPTTKKSVTSLVAVAILCFPIIPYVILAEMSRDRNSPAWILVALPAFTLLVTLPTAAIVAIVATIRHRAPVWSLITIWIILLLSTIALLSIQGKNPFGG